MEHNCGVCKAGEKHKSEELKQSYNWNMGNKRGTMKKTGKKASHEVCRPCVKTVLSKNVAQLYLTFKVYSHCIPEREVWVVEKQWILWGRLGVMIKTSNQGLVFEREAMWRMLELSYLGEWGRKSKVSLKYLAWENQEMMVSFKTLGNQWREVVCCGEGKFACSMPVRIRTHLLHTHIWKKVKD